MFSGEEPRELADTLTSEAIRELCPWLWAFERVWAAGICSQTGSRHALTPEVLRQVPERSQWLEVMHLHVHGGVQTVEQVAYPKSDDPDPLPSIAQVVARHYPDWLDLARHSIPVLVIAIPGSVDRSTHYLIYTVGDNDNLLPMIKECAQQPAVVPAA